MKAKYFVHSRFGMLALSLVMMTLNINNIVDSIKIKYERKDLKLTQPTLKGL